MPPDGEDGVRLRLPLRNRRAALRRGGAGGARLGRAGRVGVADTAGAREAAPAHAPRAPAERRLGHHTVRFRAFDLATGELAWTAKLPASAQASPLTYRARPDGRQLVVKDLTMDTSLEIGGLVVHAPVSAGTNVVLAVQCLAFTVATAITLRHAPALRRGTCDSQKWPRSFAGTPNSITATTRPSATNALRYPGLAPSPVGDDLQTRRARWTWSLRTGT
jgi:hypothetical protein